MSEKETIPLLSIKKNQPSQPVQTISTKTIPIQFKGYGSAASAWCGHIKK